MNPCCRLLRGFKNIFLRIPKLMVKFDRYTVQLFTTWMISSYCPFNLVSSRSKFDIWILRLADPCVGEVLSGGVLLKNVPRQNVPLQTTQGASAPAQDSSAEAEDFILAACPFCLSIIAGEGQPLYTTTRTSTSEIVITAAPASPGSACPKIRTWICFWLLPFTNHTHVIHKPYPGDAQ